MNWEKEIKRATWASIPLLVLYGLLWLGVKGIEALARRGHR